MSYTHTHTPGNFIDSLIYQITDQWRLGGHLEHFTSLFQYLFNWFC